MKLYDENGYLNFRELRDSGYPFVIAVGGRATGKTYGALRSSVEDGIKYMYMRRRQTQIDIINKPQFSPIKSVCNDTGLQITMRPVAKGLSAFVPYTIDEDGKEIAGTEAYGYTCALSTVSNLRGFDASDLDMIIYDEFIPEKTEKSIPHEAEALFNCYETMNRNRELVGKKPLQLVCLGNANDQTAPILEHLHLITRLDRMRKTGQQVYKDDKRGLLVVLLKDSPISEAKENTALYRLTEDTEFAKMSLGNEFAYEDRGKIVSRPLREYRPVVSIGEIVIYRHKSKECYYVCTHMSGSPAQFDISETGIIRFQRVCGYLWFAYLENKVEFEDYLCQVLFTKYLT